MSKETDALFRGFRSLEEIREILRETTPGHDLSEEQEKKLKEHVDSVKGSLDNIEKWL